MFQQFRSCGTFIFTQKASHSWGCIVRKMNLHHDLWVCSTEDGLWVGVIESSHWLANILLTASAVLEFAGVMFWLSKDGLAASGLWSIGIFREKSDGIFMRLFFAGLKVLDVDTALDEVTSFDKVLETTMVLGTFHWSPNGELSLRLHCCTTLEGILVVDIPIFS